MKRTYIVTCGLHEDNHNAFVTDDIDKAVKFALTVYRTGIFWDNFSTIEVWEDGVLICDYGSRVDHKARSYAKENLSFSIFKEDLEKAVEKVIKEFSRA